MNKQSTVSEVGSNVETDNAAQTDQRRKVAPKEEEEIRKEIKSDPNGKKPCIREDPNLCQHPYYSECLEVNGHRNLSPNPAPIPRPAPPPLAQTPDPRTREVAL